MIDGRRAAASGLIVIALVWLGLLLGVSFVATPAKFLAPSLTLPVALDVGRHTFKIFTMIEIVIAIAVPVLAFAAEKAWTIRLMALAVSGLVVLQFVWLLPVLDSRVEIILQGGILDDTYLHNLYVAVESAKAALLVFLAWRGFRGRDRVGLEWRD